MEHLTSKTKQKYLVHPNTRKKKKEKKREDYKLNFDNIKVSPKHEIRIEKNKNM